MINRRNHFRAARVSDIHLGTRQYGAAASASKRTKERGLPKARLRDLGFMIMLVRQIDADLEKIDATVSDLRELIGNKRFVRPGAPATPPPNE